MSREAFYKDHEVAIFYVADYKRKFLVYSVVVPSYKIEVEGQYSGDDPPIRKLKKAIKKVKKLHKSIEEGVGKENWESFRTVKALKNL